MRIGGLILAAGEGRRFGGDKPLAEVRGRPLLEHAVAAMLAVMWVVATLVYDHLGVAVVKQAWVNLDAVWAGAFVLAGVLTLFT